MSILQEKNLLFIFYTSTFTIHQHQFIYSIHLFNKISIHFTFFIISFHLDANRCRTKSPTLSRRLLPSDQFSVTVSVRSILYHRLRPINYPSPTSVFPTHLPPKLTNRTQFMAREISVELSSSSSSKPEILKKKEKLIGFVELRWEKERAVMKWERESWDKSQT